MPQPLHNVMVDSPQGQVLKLKTETFEKMSLLWLKRSLTSCTALSLLFFLLPAWLLYKSSPYTQK